MYETVIAVLDYRKHIVVYNLTWIKGRRAHFTRCGVNYRRLICTITCLLGSMRRHARHDVINHILIGVFFTLVSLQYARSYRVEQFFFLWRRGGGGKREMILYSWKDPIAQRCFRKGYINSKIITVGNIKCQKKTQINAKQHNVCYVLIVLYSTDPSVYMCVWWYV